ncbi:MULTISPECIES: DUF1838 family protein [Alteromonadaceae]|uniref:DUF1838 family protein n=1 Tax=Alteromonadaceae TaxID=72275 RepID=UPI003108443B
MDSKKLKTNTSERRDFLLNSGKILIGGGVAASGTLALAGCATDRPAKPFKASGALPYHDPEWNRDAMARLQGDLDFGKQKFGYFAGIVNGVRPNEKVKPLFGFEGFSYARLIDEGNGVYGKVLKEVGFYTDLETGDVLEEWTNPYTNETVKVVPVANDPFNYKLTPYVPEGPSYGGLIKTEKKKIPMLYPWKETPNNTVTLNRHIHLFYPNALQPDTWPRESSGPMNRVSEMFNYVINKDDLANPDLTSIQYSGAWSRITPWLPWMLMGQAEGHCFYDCEMGGYNSSEILSPKIRAYAEKHYPEYFEAPTEWYGPSLSSLENYARQQKPAPVKK